MLRYITCYVVLCLSNVIEHVLFMSCYITCYFKLRYITCYVMLCLLYNTLCLCYVCYITCYVMLYNMSCYVCYVTCYVI